MAIFKCDSCGYERDVPDKLVGKKAKCPDCGHGVSIVETLPPEPEEAETSEPEEGASDEAAYEAVADDISAGSIDLDADASDVELDDDEDVICDNCGLAVPASHDESCPDCGNELKRAADFPDLSEDDIDVSDLADEESEEPVWEGQFEGGGRETLEAGDTKQGPSLLEGSFPLNIFAGLVSGGLAIFFAIAMALLASSQEIVQPYLPFIMTASFSAMIAASILYAFSSRIPFALAGPETVLIAVVFLMTGSLVDDLGGYGPDIVVPTLIAAIATSSFVVGFSLWLVGKLKAGEYIRYIPLQIIGGVIGGIGVLVVLGALDWIGPLVVNWDNLPVAIKQSVLRMHWAESLSTMGPGFVFGVILFIGLRKYKNSLFMLGLLLIASAVGYGAGLWGESLDLRSLASPVPGLESGVPLFIADRVILEFESIQWVIIKGQALNFCVLAGLTVLTAMYRITGLEMIHGREVDMSEEYRTLGTANMVIALCGGLASTVSYGRSAGSHASGGRGPVVGIVAGLVCAVGLYFVEYIIPLVPRFVPEGILIFAGLSLIRDWMFKSRTAFTRRDDIWMLWFTFLVTVLIGVDIGVGFGVALALIVTVCRTSKGGAVRNVLSGSNHRSNVDRAPAQQRTLKEFGDHIHILRLQGFLFLGSMTRLLKDIQNRLDNRDMLPVEYLLLDFRRVTGLASAVGIGFDKLRNLVEEYGIELIITSAPLELEEHLEKSGHLGDEEGQFKVFFNLDYAMEWCENHVLDSENMLELKSQTLPQLLEPVFPEPKYIPALMKVLKRVDAKKGEAVFRQGDESDSMFFVESGRLDVELELEGGKLIRLKKVGPGAVFGEMGIYTAAPRSATVRAAEKCVLYKMTTKKLEAVEKRAPMLVTALNRFMIKMLSDRLADANTKVRDLMV